MSQRNWISFVALGLSAVALIVAISPEVSRLRPFGHGIIEARLLVIVDEGGEPRILLTAMPDDAPRLQLLDASGTMRADRINVAWFSST